jgi:hypothetical protein
VTKDNKVRHPTQNASSARSLLDQSDPTCRADAMDDTKPSTQDSVNNVLAWFANVPQAPRAAFRLIITALTPKSSAPGRSEILNILAKQCPLIVTTCEMDAMDTNPLTVLQALRIVYRYAITALTLGSTVYVAVRCGPLIIIIIIGIYFLATKL